MNSTDIFNKGPVVYEITRRTPRARGLSWGGTVSFAVGLVFLYSQILDFLVRGTKFSDTARLSILTRVVYLRAGIIAIFLIVIACVLWGASITSQHGTITIDNDMISCKCKRSFLDIRSDQVTSVHRHGNLVKIIYSEKTLTIKSEKASQITDRVQDFISTYRYSDKQTPAITLDSTISANKIREYKKLVDDGIITQEQFDEIIKKLTKV